MMSICFKEGVKIKPDVLTDIIINTNHDVRLIINHLSVLASGNNLNMPLSSKYVSIVSNFKNILFYDKKIKTFIF